MKCWFLARDQAIGRLAARNLAINEARKTPAENEAACQGMARMKKATND